MGAATRETDSCRSCIEIDPLVRPKCGLEMQCSFAFANLPQFGSTELQSSAVILDPVEIRDILAYLVKTGRTPPRIRSDPAKLRTSVFDPTRILGQVRSDPGAQAHKKLERLSRDDSFSYR